MGILRMCNLRMYRTEFGEWFCRNFRFTHHTYSPLLQP